MTISRMTEQLKSAAFGGISVPAGVAYREQGPEACDHLHNQSGWHPRYRGFAAPAHAVAGGDRHGRRALVSVPPLAFRGSRRRIHPTRCCRAPSRSLFRCPRPQLAAARRAKKAKATLIIAKLDRLARNVHFISGLMESGVDFVAAVNPHANKLMVHLLAAFAEHEREQISQRTKAALAAAKVRGIRLGRNGADRLAPAYRADAVERARQLAPLLTELKGAGMSARQMAVELTVRGILTLTGARWHAQTVLRNSARSQLDRRTRRGGRLHLHSGLSA